MNCVKLAVLVVKIIIVQVVVFLDHFLSKKEVAQPLLETNAAL